MTLEKLLNILLERGWKPRNREKTLHICCYDKCKGMDYQWVHLDGGFMNEDSKKFRELVSKDSGLWQFVCENKLLPKKNGYVWNLINRYDNDITIKWIEEYNCLYYIIESSLKNESELEQFLLDNIKIGND